MSKSSREDVEVEFIRYFKGTTSEAQKDVIHRLRRIYWVQRGEKL